MQTDHIAQVLPHPTLYYRRRGVLVTTDYMLANGSYYEIAGLSGIHPVRSKANTGLVVGVILAAIEVVLLLPFIGQLRSPLGLLVATVALLVPCVVGVLCARIWRPRLELLAQYRGRRVALFATSDYLEFAQMVRALHRAVEASHRARAR